MKFGRFFVLMASSLWLVACSNTRMPKATYAEHENGQGIPAIDDMIVSLKTEYIENCYKPVAKHNPPDNGCQTELFQLLERRYRLSYSQEHVDMASDELFFRDVDARIRKMVKTDAALRQDVRDKFSSLNEVTTYYKSKYGFNPVTSGN